MNKPIVGIIGGAGVAASAELIARMESLVTGGGAFLDQHHPEIVLFQATQAPSRSMFVEGRGESFVPAYVDLAQRLGQIGAERIAMCCNTAHVAIDELREKSGLQFIDLIAETLATLSLQFPEARKVGVLCSDGTRISGIYDTYVKAGGGKVELIYPDTAHQGVVTQGIRNIKRGLHRTGQVSEQPQTLFAAAADHLADQGAEVILLACTEIPLALTAVAWTRCPLIDTIGVLARACLREAGVINVEN